jgi:hypothetical protein
MKLTIHFHVVLRLRMSGTIPPVPLALMACTEMGLPLPYINIFYKSLMSFVMPLKMAEEPKHFRHTHVL